MPMYRYCCPDNHITEIIAPWNQLDIICPEIPTDTISPCNKIAPRQISQSTHIWKDGKPSG